MAAARIDFEKLHDLSLRLAGAQPYSSDNIYVDYLLTLTLPQIQNNFKFVLKGGTALVKAWLGPYRFSYDLDFSYFSKRKNRVQYKEYRTELENFVAEMGYKIVKDKETHREGGRIFILYLMDTGFLKRPIKLSISSIDQTVCFTPIIRKFRLIRDVPEIPYGRMYPDIIQQLNEANANVCTIEELCAEKIRALATRGETVNAVGKDGIKQIILSNVITRDIFDLYILEKEGVLDKVLKNNDCIKSKFHAIKKMTYYQKFQNFLNMDIDIKITDEDRAIFSSPGILTDLEANRIVKKVQAELRKLEI